MSAPRYEPALVPFALLPMGVGPVDHNRHIQPRLVPMLEPLSWGMPLPPPCQQLGVGEEEEEEEETDN